jgi:hypothetical protein
MVYRKEMLLRMPPRRQDRDTPVQKMTEVYIALAHLFASVRTLYFDDTTLSNLFETCLRISSDLP